MADVFEQLDREWQRMRHDRDLARRLGEVCREAGGAATLEDVERYVRGAAPADADRVLLALVTRVVERGDACAARVLLQLLLPGTRSLARRWWALGDHDERAAAAVAAVYERIERYPLARRPGRVAANILMDASRALRRAVPRLLAEPSPDVGRFDVRATAPPAAVATSHAGVELVEVLCDAVGDGLIRAADAELIGRTRLAGDRLSSLSRRRGIPERTLFAHRQRAERALAAAYAAGP